MERSFQDLRRAGACSEWPRCLTSPKLQWCLFVWCRFLSTAQGVRGIAPFFSSAKNSHPFGQEAWALLSFYRPVTKRQLRMHLPFFLGARLSCEGWMVFSSRDMTMNNSKQSIDHDFCNTPPQGTLFLNQRDFTACWFKSLRPLIRTRHFFCGSISKVRCERLTRLRSGFGCFVPSVIS